MQLFERTLGEWLEYWVEKTPDKEFIVYSDRDLRFTYKQFDQRVNNLAKGLLSIGVTTGSHLGNQRSRLAHVPFRFGQNRSRTRYRQYQLQATRARISHR